ncbi:MAG: hypothetical protein ACI4C5_00610 [Lachnospiraceae bacterium]
MSNEAMKKEMMEAIQAGERALFSLRTVEKKLNSARNWGIFDMLGGGFLTDLIKHSNMNDASAYMEEAKQNLLIFQRELKDVQIHFNLTMEISSFLTFADFFFDGIIADYLMQTKIADARDEVENAIYQVQQVLNELRAEYSRIL